MWATSAPVRTKLRPDGRAPLSDIKVTVKEVTHSSGLNYLYCELWVTNANGSRLGGVNGMKATKKCAVTRAGTSEWKGETFEFNNASVNDGDFLAVHIYGDELVADLEITLQDVVDRSSVVPCASGERKWSFQETIKSDSGELFAPSGGAVAMLLNVQTTVRCASARARAPTRTKQLVLPTNTNAAARKHPHPSHSASPSSSARSQTKERIATSSAKKPPPKSTPSKSPAALHDQKLKMMKLKKVRKALDYSEQSQKAEAASKQAAAEKVASPRPTPAAGGGASPPGPAAPRLAPLPAPTRSAKPTAMWRHIAGASFFVPWLLACVACAALPAALSWAPFAAVALWLVVRKVLWWVVCKRTSPQWQKLAAGSFFVPWVLACGVAAALPPRLGWAPFAAAAALLAALHTLRAVVDTCGC
jgi:hypothetical protein